MEKKIGHIEKEVRELAAKSLGLFCMMDIEYTTNEILPELLQEA
jgi:hypothetical protein